MTDPGQGFADGGEEEQVDSRLLDQDLYAVLGVSKDADAKTIKSAYRKLARTHHPDKNSSASSEDKFKAASAAYEILSDEGKRKEYDEGRALLATGRSSRQQPGGMEWDLEDLLNAFNQTGGGFTSARANQPTRGRNVEADLEVSVEDILQGRTLTLTMRGAGAAEEVKVRMDPTTVNGDRVTVRGKGEEGTQGRGDLLLKVHIKDGPAWQLDGTSLEQDLEVDYTTAVLGGTVTVHTPRGQSMTLKVKAGTKDGRKLRISGEGLGRSGSRGDARWRIRIKVPSSINEQAKKALLDYQQALEGNPQ